jgi:folate-binding protein YgfZ
VSESRLSQLRREGGAFALAAAPRLRVTGADRVRYLNGQVSNDLRGLTDGEARQALVLTAKGKLCALVLIWTEPGALIVESLGVDGEDLLARLERYAISDDVAFELLPAPASAWHVFGPAAASVNGLRVDRLGCAGADVAGLPAGVLTATSEECELLRIERGLPQWGRELNEDTLPQEAGLEKNTVDFRKGCYVGQEVVSRIQSVGRVNRHLAGLVGDFDPARAATLQTASGEKAGTVTSAIFHPELGRTAALGYVSTRLADTSFVVLDESGACLGAAERSEFPLVS